LTNIKDNSDDISTDINRSIENFRRINSLNDASGKIMPTFTGGF
jgi:hypothetical protein